MIVELAIFTRIPVSAWLAESDDVIQTGVKIMLERARDNVRQAKESKAAELNARRRSRRRR